MEGRARPYGCEHNLARQVVSADLFRPKGTNNVSIGLAMYPTWLVVETYLAEEWKDARLVEGNVSNTGVESCAKGLPYLGSCRGPADVYPFRRYCP